MLRYLEEATDPLERMSTGKALTLNGNAGSHHRLPDAITMTGGRRTNCVAPRKELLNTQDASRGGHATLEDVGAFIRSDIDQPRQP